MFSSRTSIDTTTAYGGDGNANNSVTAVAAGLAPRKVVVLYRYFSQELLRLVRSSTAASASQPGRGDRLKRDLV